MSAVTTAKAAESGTRRPRSPWIAGLFGFLMPGLGHFYVGRARRGIAVFLVFLVIFWFELAWKYGLLPRAWAGLVVLAAFLASVLFSVIDAALTARRTSSFELRRYNRWWVYPSLWLWGWLTWTGATAIVDSIAITLALPLSAHFSVVNASMEPTLRQGETLIADTRYYRRNQPSRGDVAVFLQPHGSVTAIKRIVALPGDRVSVRAGRVILNGAPLDEAYVQVKNPAAAINNIPEVVVPAAHVFALGDNRDNSADSRVGAFGPVPVVNLIGRAADIVLSRDLGRLGRFVGAPQAEPGKP